MARSIKTKTEPRGIQSATVAMKILQVMVNADGRLHLKDIASAAGMDSSNAYRYLVSFANAGLVLQHPDGRYDLGPFAVQLGLAAASRMNGLEILTSGLERLLEKTGADGHISVWSGAGPMVVRWRGQPDGVVIRLAEGSVLPLTTTATGRIWGAYLPKELFDHVFLPQLRTLKLGAEGLKSLKAKYARDLERIRKDGLSVSHGERRAGIDAMAGPVFDASGNLVFTITMLGPSGGLDCKLNGNTATQLRRTLVELSTGLGASRHVLGRYPWYTK